jgi:hypothetical protein
MHHKFFTPTDKIDVLIAYFEKENCIKARKLN